VRLNDRHLIGYYIQRSHASNVEKLQGGVMRVRSESVSGKFYTVRLASIPRSCGCEDWRKRHLPCKHIYAAIERLRSQGVSVYDLPKLQMPSARPKPQPRVEPDVEDAPSEVSPDGEAA
jgi:SWIM zinc finger